MKAEDTEKVWYKSPLGAERGSVAGLPPRTQAASQELSSDSRGVALSSRLEAPGRCASVSSSHQRSSSNGPPLPPAPHFSAGLDLMAVCQGSSPAEGLADQVLSQVLL